MNVKGLFGILLLLGLLSVPLFVTRDSEGTTTLPRCAIIIVSDLDGFDPEELEKAYQFYQYLLDKEYTDEDIYFLTEGSRYGSDGAPTISNIESAFSWLQNTSESSSQPVVYISDHVIWALGNVTFRFSDGNITTSAINSWLNSTIYQELTMILTGNRSGLACEEISSNNREVISSMRWDQTFHPDPFNITRGLRDSSADINRDGEVSYYEAFLKERYTLRFSDQDPQYLSG